ncbi:MAG TPA: hypothetical protein VIW69_10180, partial [Candidatus Elarobacter sp.]
MRTPFTVMLALACAFTAAGCSKNDQSSTTSTASSQASAMPAPDASPSASAVVSPSAAAAASAPSPLASVGFTDVDGVQGQKEIVLLAQLGVLDAAAGPFHPGDAIQRRDFVRWLFKTNNAVWADQPSRQIHAADAS